MRASDEAGWVTKALRAQRVPTRIRMALCLAGGLVGGAITAQSNALKPYARDFGQVWYAARAVLHGLDPYQLIGPGRAYPWPGTFFYPLPAAIVATPLAPLSEPWACVIFSFLTGAALAWALSEYGYGPLFAFFSAPVHFAFENAQWSPLLAASLVVPPIGALLICKPTIGLALMASRPSRWSIGGAIALLILAFVVQPGWIPAWRGALAMTTFGSREGFPYLAPATLPGGVLALACLTRWRRPEARLVAALACVPQTLMLYEAVPLLFVARTFRQALVFVILGYAIFYYLALALPHGVDASRYVETSGRAIALVLYPAATAMVLTRPNEGAASTWVERRIAAWPSWIRGRSLTDT